ncbi:DUF3267 domain-containing protein [Bacillus pinisoli]|uniref:DUF3267 domain-containing protein n=1 Tax=Bacillus pinisoli TaxID=2901866 RepID=UPI001FF49D3B|nr:DUF3267 domain-containing protein [Bacillus pinisoli]
MTCWKTINLSKDYGFHRLFFLSFLISILAFIVMYVSMQLFFHSRPLEDNGLIYVCLIALLLVPGHQIIHIMALKLMGKKVQTKIVKKGIFPIITIKQCGLLSKPVALLTILAPIMFFSMVLFLFSLMYPAYMHYVSILIAINIGICVSDLLYSYHIFKAPRKCMLDENNGGYDIILYEENM